MNFFNTFQCQLCIVDRSIRTEKEDLDEFLVRVKIGRKEELVQVTGGYRLPGPNAAGALMKENRGRARVHRLVSNVYEPVIMFLANIHHTYTPTHL